MNVDWAASLLRAQDILAAGHDPATAALEAVASALMPFQPTVIDLSILHAGPDGQPNETELVQAWDGGKLSDDPRRGKRLPLEDLPWAERVLAAPTEPLVLDDIAACSARHPLARALAVLPLYSRRHRTWLGLLSIRWATPHRPSDAEVLAYRLLMNMVSESIASERALRELQTTLEEAETQRTTAERTLAESRAQQRTLGFLLEHLPIGISMFNGATGQQEMLNQAGAALLASGARDDLTGYAPMFYVPGEPELLPPEQWPFTLALRTGKRQGRELEYGRPDGSRFLLDITALPLHFEGDPVPHIVIVFQDITPTRIAQRERIIAQEKLLQAQALALAERATPLIPIRKDVLVMPLVGSIDAERGRQILETLVGLGGASGIRAAIIDVTGTKNLDTAAARVLINAARALRLRGVQPVITGIQQGAAMTLVQMGVDFSGIVIRGTLQDGVDAAIQ